MKSYFAYTRVSTARQGEHGSSLQEQVDAIKSFAARNNFAIAAWFEERETAAKIGRREFSRMLTALKKGTASGIIFHKIDRSARNLKDWSAIQDLADQGIDVRFTQESVNLGSNEGKLTGDFLAVIASHYIRNLREEVRKGMRGRLKQGLYPLAAPIGYLDQGGGKPKIPDQIRAPFVRDAFELYAAGGYSLHMLSDELYCRGLRSKSGKRFRANALAKLLRNPFYIGIIRMKRSGESYLGVHEPLIPKSLFDRVQAVLDGKATARVNVHDFLFRRMIACAHCGYRLVGELQKGNVYYRCHTRGCPTCSVREDAARSAIQARLAPLILTEEEGAELRDRATRLLGNRANRREEALRSIKLQIENLNGRISRLIDAHLDETIERPLFEEKKLALLLERKALDEGRARIAEGQDPFGEELLEFLELLKNLPLSYEMAEPQEKREILKTITSNFRVDRKNVVVELRSPFQEIANLSFVSFGGPVRRRPRNFTKKIFGLLVTHCTWAAQRCQREENSPPLAA